MLQLANPLFQKYWTSVQWSIKFQLQLQLQFERNACADKETKKCEWYDSLKNQEVPCDGTRRDTLWYRNDRMLPIAMTNQTQLLVHYYKCGVTATFRNLPLKILGQEIRSIPFSANIQWFCPVTTALNCTVWVQSASLSTFASFYRDPNALNKMPLDILSI